MLRRLHAPRLSVGDIPLDPSQARHARDVLRLEEGAVVEVFDDTGQVGWGNLKFGGAGSALVAVQEVRPPAVSGRIVVASAIPKGERADWMIEKLSELGVDSFIPLAAERSVTLPQGRNKFERWVRLATESAKQSRRVGVMSIERIVTVDELISDHKSGYVLSTAEGAMPILEALPEDASETLLVVGPEGGWSDGELGNFNATGFIPLALTRSILRVETAAVAAAAIVAVRQKTAGTHR